MANSKLLKEAIADAKAVRETAIANAKIALEEAFTPRLQSILSKKLQAEMEGEDEEPMEEELDSSDIGNGDEETPVEPSANADDAHTELGSETEEESDEVGEEDENVDVVSEEEDHEDEVHEEDEVEVEDEDEVEDEIEEEDDVEDELDLEAIIRELEGELGDEESEYEETYEGEEEEYEEGTYEGEGHDEEEVTEDAPAHDAVGFEDPTNADDASIDEEEDEEMIDLEEILREMGYGDDEEEVSEEEHEEEDHSELEEELETAYATIKELQSTINEVNLLNAKLLYANKLFRGYALTNEQKAKVVENLDRTSSVREVKLVYATLAESMNFTGTEKKTKRAISESVSKATKSTAPVKEVITESADALAERFKKLANIK
jgi:hypothetical protein